MSAPKPVRHRPADRALARLLDLVRESFAYMDGRIDPPSSVHRLTAADIAAQCETGEVWSIGDPPHACMFLTLKPDCLYIGKMAVAESRRGSGLARALIDLASERARVMALSWLELETRVELAENHATFEKLGFTQFGEKAHSGFDRPTSIVMRKPVLPG